MSPSVASQLLDGGSGDSCVTHLLFVLGCWPATTRKQGSKQARYAEKRQAPFIVPWAPTMDLLFVEMLARSVFILSAVASVDEWMTDERIFHSPLRSATPLHLS